MTKAASAALRPVSGQARYQSNGMPAGDLGVSSVALAVAGLACVASGGLGCFVAAGAAGISICAAKKLGDCLSDCMEGKPIPDPNELAQEYERH